jgi:uncharacterized protein (TIGR02145 family)
MNKQLYPIICATFILIITLNGAAQVGINNTGRLPDNSAILDVLSTEKGMLIPRLTDNEINSIDNPANGLQVFCTSDSRLYIYVASEHRWKNVAYGPGELILPAIFILGTGDTCSNVVIGGTYMINASLLSLNKVTLQVNVVKPGTWAVLTEPVNGYSFSARGSFSSTGIHTITLQGSGTPFNSQTDEFIVYDSGGAGSCKFNIKVLVPPDCGSPFLDSRDGASYNTVLIYTQCWMARNLNIGTKIENSLQQTNNDIIEKYCYNNSETNCNIYGGLYQWAEMIKYLNGASNSTTWSPIPKGSVTGICPTGWHIPTDEEWTILTTYLEGESVAGGKIKEAGITHWASPNTGATNSSGFTALPGGYCADNTNFLYLSNQATFWSSTGEMSIPPYNQAWHRHLYYNYELVQRYYNTKTTGYSVRCLKDF